MSGCTLRTVLSADLGPAMWALDPAFPRPPATTAELHILVWELACSGGSPATGRISAPVVEYAEASVTITLGVRLLDASSGVAFTCPGPPGTPATTTLTEPLGNRSLLDGGLVPPMPSTPMF